MSVQNILDEYYPPLSKYQKRVERNNELTANEIAILYEFVDSFETQEEKFDWESGVDSIIPVVKRFQATDVVSVSTNEAGFIPKSPKATPFLITQVLFYLGVACSFYNDISASKVLDVLKDKGLNLSHNFYTKLNLNSYVEMLKYHQPEMLFNYNGAKHKELGVALKNLVYQAGAYNTFVDVFGGSGAASVSMPRKRNAVYVYNDLDKSLANLFKVLSDKNKHKELIKYLGYLQKDLRGEEDWDIVDLQAEAIKYFDSRKANNKTRFTERELRVVEDLRNLEESGVDEDYIIGFMNSLYEKVKDSEILKDKDDFLKTCFSDYIKKGDLYALISSYTVNHRYIIDYIKTNFIPIDIDYELEHQARAKQLRLYYWYAYFDNGNISDDILSGVATIFLYSFTTNNAVDISNVLRSYIDINEIIDGGSRESTTYEEFINKDFESLIETLYKYLKNNKELLSKRDSQSDRSLDSRTIIENLDCFKLLDKYLDRKKALIYSDSPYLNTADYRAGGFNKDKENMTKLITKLQNSKQKFIFSCRACLSGNRATKEGNQELYENLFKVFKGNLWVCVVGKDFWKSIRNNEIAEVFITNYEIHSFTDRKYKKVKFEVYDYNTFMNLLEKNINK